LKEKAELGAAYLGGSQPLFVLVPARPSIVIVMRCYVIGHER
jgi:hypothetical protein